MNKAHCLACGKPAVMPNLPPVPGTDVEPSYICYECVQELIQMPEGYLQLAAMLVLPRHPRRPEDYDA